MKAEACPYLTARDNKGRGWEQVIAILNQARAYNYLVDVGCRRVHFLKPVKQHKRKTPDLEAELGGKEVVCEVKTLNTSQEEVTRRQTGGVGSGTSVLSAPFFEKLDSVLQKAESQMASYGDAKHIVFLIVNFGDLLGEYKEDYFEQIDCHLDSHPRPEADIVVFNQRTAFHRPVSMRNAKVVNEAN